MSSQVKKEDEEAQNREFKKGVLSVAKDECITTAAIGLIEQEETRVGKREGKVGVRGGP